MSTGNWTAFEQLVDEAKTHLPIGMNDISRRVALGRLVRGIEQTKGDVQAYRDSLFVLNGGVGRFNRVPGKREQKVVGKGKMWLRGKDTKTWVPPKAP